jgi:carbonic anhydrase
MPADAALRTLMAGNKRYVATKPLHPHQGRSHRVVLAKGQQPFAVVLGCADSRVPPEIVFDQGLGDLFVLRIAGNIVDDAVLGSIEYAVEHLGTRLIVVLGHERCGAVSAAVQAARSSSMPGASQPGGEHDHIGSLVQAIAPAVERVRDRPGDRLDLAIRANVAMVAGQLRGSTPVLAKSVKAGKLQVVGARYDLDTGVVALVK